MDNCDLETRGVVFALEADWHLIPLFIAPGQTL